MSSHLPHTKLNYRHNQSLDSPSLLKNQKGFTLIELIIVMVVLAALATIALVTYPASQRKARDAQRQSDIKQYQTAIEVYASGNSGSYPVSSGNISGLCSQLTVSACPDDPLSSQSYGHSSTATEYMLWAQMEYPDINGDPQWFVTCSTGEVGYISNTAPSGSSCVL